MPIERLGLRHVVFHTVFVITAVAAIGFSLRPESAAEIQVYFVPESEFGTFEPNCANGGPGCIWVSWRSTEEIYLTRIVLSSTEATQSERSRLIWEMLARSLGLLGSSLEYPDSIFYQDASAIGGYAAIDRTVIEMLYQADVRPGMTGEQAWAVVGDNYEQSGIGYFAQVALETGYGDTGGVIHKWVSNPTVRVYGSPTEVDWEVLGEVVEEINTLVSDVQLVIDESN